MSEHKALDIWRRTLIRSVRNEAADLTARQMAVLLTVYLKAGPHTVRDLAKILHISKPAVTRALDRLSDLDLLRRKADDRDRRSVVIQRTVKGSVFLSEFADSIVKAAAKSGVEIAPVKSVGVAA